MLVLGLLCRNAWVLGGGMLPHYRCVYAAWLLVLALTVWPSQRHGGEAERGARAFFESSVGVRRNLGLVVSQLILLVDPKSVKHPGWCAVDG